MHVVNVDIQDSHEEAILGAFLICKLCRYLQHTENMESQIDEPLQEFQEKSGCPFCTGSPTELYCNCGVDRLCTVLPPPPVQEPLP